MSTRTSLETVFWLQLPYSHPYSLTNTHSWKTMYFKNCPKVLNLQYVFPSVLAVLIALQPCNKAMICDAESAAVGTTFLATYLLQQERYATFFLSYHPHPHHFPPTTSAAFFHSFFTTARIIPVSSSLFLSLQLSLDICIYVNCLNHTKESCFLNRDSLHGALNMLMDSSSTFLLGEKGASTAYP